MSQDAPELPEPTGVPAVDEVVAHVESLRQRPLEEHAQVFEAAHDRLRRALDPADPEEPDQPDEPHVP